MSLCLAVWRHLPGGLALTLGAALAGCYGNADRGRTGPRLAPVAVGAGAAPPVPATRVFDLEPGWRSRAAMALVRAGVVRRLALPLGVPSETVTRVPEGVRELHLAVTEPVALAPVAPDCRVEVEASWDAGAPTSRVSAPARGDAARGWLDLRLVASPRRAPTTLRLRLRRSSSCAEVPLVVAQSEVVPVAPSRLGKRPNLVLVAFAAAAAAELDCGATSRAAWPRVHGRWCARGVAFTEAWAETLDPARGLAGMVTGRTPAAGASRCPPGSSPTLAALLQREGYATFAVVPAPLRGEAFGGFDTLVEVGAAGGTGIDAAREAVGRVLAFLAEAPREPFFVGLVLPPVEPGAAAAFDRELDRVVEVFVRSRLEGRTAFVVAAATGAAAPQVEDAAPERLRVPLLVVPPARGGRPPALQRAAELVAVSDVYATALALTGTPIPVESVARDLTWALDGVRGLGRPYVASEACRDAACTLVVTTPELRAVARGDAVQVTARAHGRSDAAPADTALSARGIELVERLRAEAAPASP